MKNNQQVFYCFILFVVVYVITGCEYRKTMTYNNKKYKIKRESLFCNVRAFFKDNIYLRAHPIKDGHNYTMLEIGTPSSPYLDKPELLIKLRNGSIINLSKVTPTFIQKHGHVFNEDFCSNSCYKRGKEYEKWPDTAKQWVIYPWNFIINKGKIEGVSIIYNPASFKEENKEKEHIPAIGKVGNRNLKEFPLSETDIIDIFGVPDEVIEYFQP